MEEQQPISQATQPMTNEDTVQKKGFPIKTLLLIIILAIIAFGLAGYAVFNNNLTNETETAQIPTVTPIKNPVQTILTISSDLTKLSTPSAYSSDIIINTGQDMVNKVQLEISYDPKVLTKVDVSPGLFFTDPQIFLKNIDPVNGRISFAFGVHKNENGQVGQGVLAKLTFTAVQKVASTSVSLLPKTQVTADGFSESVLQTTIDGLFNLKGTASSGLK
jgi:hypothetical protein